MNILNEFGKLYEPKKENRFIVNLPEIFDIPSFMVYAINRPSFTVKEYRIDYDPIEIKFKDGIDIPISNKLYKIFIGITTAKVDDILHPEFIAECKSKFVKNFVGFDFDIELLDPTGNVIEKWLLKDCLIQKINMGQLDYTSDKTIDCSMVVKPTRSIMVIGI